MEAAWFAPPVVAVFGAFGVAVLVRKLDLAADELDRARRRFRRLEDAVIPIRVETRRARGSIDRFDRR